MRLKVCLTAAILLTFSKLLAVPVRPSTFTVVQPDGKRLELTVIGDETGHMTVTADGIAVAEDAGGVWRYADNVLDGNPVPGRIMAHNPSDRSFAEKLGISVSRQREIREEVLCNHSRQTAVTRAAAAPGDYSMTGFNTKGSPRVLVVLVEFPDLKFTMDSASILQAYDDIYNHSCVKDSATYSGIRYERPYGSVRDYFEKQSYGVFSPSFDIIGPFTASKGYAEYGRNQSGGTSAPHDANNARKLVEELCNTLSLREDISLDDYDSDGDGYIDMMAVIYAGNGENYSGADPNTIWPHSWSLSKRYGEKISGVNYFLTCELFWDSRSELDGIGTFCHEFSHVLGLPDLYYTSYGDDVGNPNFGYWSIMDYGVYENEGFYPVGYTAMERFSLGWLDLEAITRDSICSLADINSGNGHAMRLDTDNDHCFFILENHNRSGWDKYERASGLMVSCVSYDSFAWKKNMVNPSADNRRHYLIPADGVSSRKTSGGDLFPHQGNDSITVHSVIPIASGGHKPSLGIYGITRDGNGNVTFHASADGTSGIDLPTGNATESDVRIFDLTGREQHYTRENLPRGVWIVCSDGKSVKFSVR